MNEHSDRELHATVAILEKIKLRKQKGCMQERGDKVVSKSAFHLTDELTT